MWNVKRFKTEKAARQWMDGNADRYQMLLVWIHNGCAVEYKRLRVVG
jgi:hypothetical protein